MFSMSHACGGLPGLLYAQILVYEFSLKDFAHSDFFAIDGKQYRLSLCLDANQM